MTGVQTCALPIYIRDLIRQGDDGIWFIDYACAVESELDEIEMYPIFLKTHRDLIISRSERYQALSGIMSKYVWLAHYHNQVISEMSDKWFEHYNLKRNELIITEQDVIPLEKV